MRRSNFHVRTPQEICHDLKEANVFPEMDMGWGYHQIELEEEFKTRAIFQTEKRFGRILTGN